MALCLGHKFRAVDAAGNPLAAGLVYTYDAGTTNAKTTYSNRALSSENANPVVLDAAGEADIYLSGPTKLVITTAAGVAVDTVDSVDGIPANGDSPTFTDLAVTDDLTVTDDVTVGGDINVTGDVNIGDDCTVTGTVIADGLSANSGTATVSAKYHVAYGAGAYFTGPNIQLTAIAASAAQNNSLFVDTGTGTLRFKNSAGTVYIIDVTAA